jgi:hypothetical protein
MDTYTYNKYTKLWTHIPTNTHIPQSFIDSLSDDDLRKYILEEIGDNVSDVMIYMFRAIPSEIR